MKVNNSNNTIIRMKKETVEILRKIGRKGESYDTVIKKLIEILKNHKEEYKSDFVL